MNYSPQFEGLYKCGSPRKLETLFWLGSVRFAPGWLKNKTKKQGSE